MRGCKIQNQKTDTYTDTILRSEKGMVLVVSLLLLLVATVVGVTALSTSTTNVMIAGNQKCSEIGFSAADSGVSMSIPVIEAAIAGDFTTYAEFIKDTIFIDVNEDTSDKPSTYPDLRFPVADETVNVDVDYVYTATPAGCSIEFASGYDIANIGCKESFYALNSLGTCGAGSESEVCAIYKNIR